MREVKAVKEAARLIGIAIRTAPKSSGVDDVSYVIASDSQKTKIALEVKRIAGLLKAGKASNIRKAIELDWHSDAEAIYKSDCVILVGVKGRKPLGFNCGGCGFKNCTEFLKAKCADGLLLPGPFCIFKIWDLGIAVSSASKAASLMNIDNRIMFKAGIAGCQLKLIKGYCPILGLPLSASGKNIYFDRKEKLDARELWRQIGSVKNIEG